MTSVFCDVASVGSRSVSVDLLGVVVTALDVIGLFFIPAACSRHPPDVIRRRSADAPDCMEPK
ncbi:hypothetical protein [Streptomyces sp. ME19-01-6]|uniref:hypothetical protein n=1 Tax=Streptomyces sp. ME19-01-6 TaxID=3028686 RepID=UPI0029AE92F8|nr:hypothetical protein [Streptomyces sp. ME19-01-6]MDX3229180.1 hypothetical protein [Streptomyces sp. ME19-01-6]